MGHQRITSALSGFFPHQKNLYEKAAETDGELSRPKDPNWNARQNEIRLMRCIDGRTHRQICDLFKRVQRDPFWCRNILSPSKLREKWDELIIRLGGNNNHGMLTPFQFRTTPSLKVSGAKN